MEQSGVFGTQAETIALCLVDLRSGAISPPQPSVLVNLDDRKVELFTYANVQAGQRCTLLLVDPRGKSHRVTGRILRRELLTDRRTLVQLELDAPLEGVMNPRTHAQAPAEPGCAALPPAQAESQP